MFRDLTRKNRQLSAEDCISILSTEKRGVLSVNGDDGYPYGMPMNHFYNEADGCIYFHCGKGGHRLDSIEKDSKVSFCVYDSGYRADGEWALNIKSVIVFGRITVVSDHDTVCDIAAKLSRIFTQVEAYVKREIDSFAHETLLLKLCPEHICGKLVNEA